MQNIKLYAGLGDGAVGKTCLLIRYTSNSFPEEYVPTVFDNYSANVRCGDEIVNLGLWDYAARGDSERLRPLTFPGTDIFFLLFSVVNRNSFDNVKTKYYPLVKHHCPKAKTLLVGTKCDLREDKKTIAKLESQNMTMVSKSEAEEMAKEIGAEGYYETSALTAAGVKAVFDAAIECVLNGSKKRIKASKACALL
mmetsp:Transcript_18385/g.31984  ORF Transcript_18385/g.31984 Transcript_18385/m.31984 type:complete len:195 (+) Transcript_18385:80-664(+)